MRAGTSLSLRSLLLSLAVSACAGPTDPSSVVPVGLRITLNGATLVRIRGTEVNGALHTHVAEYSGQFNIVPVTGDGRELSTTEAYALEAVVADDAVATFEAVAPGAFEGEIVSHAEGATSITFRIVPRAGEPEAGYEAPAIPLIAVSCGPPGSISSASCGTAGLVTAVNEPWTPGNPSRWSARAAATARPSGGAAGWKGSGSRRTRRR